MGQEDAAVRNEIDGGRWGEGGRARGPAKRVLRQGGTANESTACATQTDDRPLRGGGRDPRPSKALVCDVPSHTGSLPDVLPAPHLWYALPSGFYSKVVQLSRYEASEDGFQRCSPGVRLHHTAWTIPRRPSSPPTRRLLSTHYCASIDLGLPQADPDELYSDDS